MSLIQGWQNRYFPVIVQESNAIEQRLQKNQDQ